MIPHFRCNTKARTQAATNRANSSPNIQVPPLSNYGPLLVFNQAYRVIFFELLRAKKLGKNKSFSSSDILV